MKICVVSFLVALGAATALAQVPSGPEFQVNTFTPGQESRSAIASDAAGNFVVAWDDSVVDGSGYAVIARRFGANGVPRGPEFRVNGYTTGDQYRPAVAVTANGSFVVVWTDRGRDGSDKGVFGRRYDSAGFPQGIEFQVNTYTTDRQTLPRIAADAAGNFVVVWTSLFQDGSAYGVFGQRYDGSGARRGTEFQVNAYTTDSQQLADVAFESSGKFIVAFSTTFGQDGDQNGISAQRFDAAGARLGAAFRVNSYTTGNQDLPRVAAAANGGSVIVWRSASGQDGSGAGVFGQRFDANGAPVSSEFAVNSYTTGAQDYPVVASAANGDFVVAWSGSDGPSLDIFGQRYDAAGPRRGGEFRINTWTTFLQQSPSVASDGAGGFVVAWESFGQDGSGMGVFGQRFGGVIPAPAVVDGGGNRVFEPGESVGVAPAWRNVSAVSQAFTGTASALGGPGAPNDPVYAIVDGAADYGVVPSGATGSCTATGNCYTFSIGVPTARPVLHWDATYREDILPLSLGQSLTRTLHVGDSFGDVARSSPFYRFVETILHHNLTSGCGGGNFCPVASTPREQMAVFVLVAKEGPAYQPPACVAGAEMFGDVPAASPFCRWIEELARRGIAGGCSTGTFCPQGSVSREQMAVLSLATAGYSPVACVAGAERFTDVPASSPFCRWVEELARQNIAGGCGGGNFCPATAVTREQNGVFLSGTFSLALY
jgi:hypothetical protein